MRIFQLLLPLSDNAGVGLASAHSSFQQVCMDMIGGYTDAGEVCGRWQGPDKVHTDTLRDYRLACDGPQFQSLLDAAHLLFPDQHSLFAAELGAAWLSERPGAAAGGAARAA